MGAARSTPAVRAATTKAVVCPTTTTADARTTPGQVRRARTACSRSVRTVRATRATRDCPSLGCVRTHSATVAASTTSVAATSGAACCTGEGSTRSTTHGDRDLDDLAGRPLPGHGADAAAEVAGLAAVADAAVHVADDAARQRAC